MNEVMTSFYLPKNRYLELKYFCRQYNYFRAIIATPERFPTSGDIKQYERAILIIEKTAYDINCKFTNMLLTKVTRGGSFEKLCAEFDEHVTKEEFMDAYKKYFYYLNKVKGF